MKAGWEVKKLDDVCDFQNGFAFKSNLFLESGFPIIRISNIQNQQVIEDDLVYFDKSDYKENFDKYQVNKGDILIAMSGGTTGKIGVNTTDKVFYLNQRVGKFRPKACLDNQYLYYFLLTKSEESLIISAGSAQPNLSTEQIKSFQLPLPSIQEQQRIVAILDQAFEGIAKARANAERNLRNARALFESHLQNVFTQRGDGWIEKKLEDVCNKITDGTHHSPQIQFSEPGENRFPYITSKNIRNNCMDLSKISYIEEAFHDEVYSRCKPDLGDVLLTKDGANTGNVTLNALDEPFSLLSSVCLIKTNQTILKPAFLCYYLQSPTGLSSIIGQMSGAAIKRIVLKDIKKAVIPFPSLDKQNEITEIFNTLLSETQRLETLYQRKIACLDELKKSLLQQAFAGEL